MPVEERAIHKHHVAFWKFLRRRTGMPIVAAGSAALVQTEINNGGASFENNDVDLWIKETIFHYLSIPRLFEIICDFNNEYKAAKVYKKKIQVCKKINGVRRYENTSLVEIPVKDPKTVYGYGSYGQTNISFIVDLCIIIPNGKPVTRASEQACNPLQLIGMWCELEDTMVFPERVVRGFDLSIVRCWIESPYRPRTVRFLDHEVKKDIECRTMTYDVKKYRGPVVFEKRVGKYMDRGFALKKFELGGSLVLNVDNASLINTKSLRSYDGTISQLNVVFSNLVNKHNGFLDKIITSRKRGLPEDNNKGSRKSQRLTKMDS